MDAIFVNLAFATIYPIKKQVLLTLRKHNTITIRMIRYLTCFTFCSFKTLHLFKLNLTLSNKIIKPKSTLTEWYLKTNINVSQIFIQPEFSQNSFFKTSDLLKSSKLSHLVTGPLK